MSLIVIRIVGFYLIRKTVIHFKRFVLSSTYGDFSVWYKLCAQMLIYILSSIFADGKV